MKFPSMTLTLLSSIMLYTTSALASTLEKAWESPAELKAPESVLYDAKRDIVFVSNVNGAPDQADGNGFISKLSLDGSITELEWASGLNAPKGLAIKGKKLYVADITALVEINIANGKIVKRYNADGAKFLNDVAIDNSNNVYVSDMVTNTIYKLSDNSLDVWLQDEKLENPNGLHIEGNRLIVGSWGKMVDGFSTDVPGHLKSVSLASGKIKSLGNGAAVGNLDGVESDGKGSYYATDWMNGGLFHIKANGNAKKLLTLEQGSADHDVILDKNLVLIPMMNQNKILAYKVK